MPSVRLPTVSLRRIALRFVLISMLGMLALAALTAFVSRRVATQEAIRDARHVTTIISTSLLPPAITPQLLAGDPTAIAAFENVLAYERNQTAVASGDTVIAAGTVAEPVV